MRGLEGECHLAISCSSAHVDNSRLFLAEYTLHTKFSPYTNTPRRRGITKSNFGVLVIIQLLQCVGGHCHQATYFSSRSLYNYSGH